MDRKLKRYTVLPSDSELTAVSLVLDPAVELPFVALSKQGRNMQFATVENGEKRYLYGVALRCNFDIYRCIGGEEFYLNFSKEAIRRMMIKYFKAYGQKNWTLEHSGLLVDGLTICESWQVEDPATDKSVKLGLKDISEGDWIIGVDVSDNEVWAQIKDGKFTGFSVEAWVNFEEIDNKFVDKHSNMSKAESTLKQIQKLLMGEMTTEEVKEVVDEVVEKVEEETETTEETIEVLEEVVDELENASDETTEEMSEEEEVAQEVVETIEDANDGDATGTEEDLQAVIDGLNAEIESLKEENEELKKQNQKMAKMPSTKVTVKQAKQTGVQGAFSVLKAQGFIS